MAKIQELLGKGSELKSITKRINNIPVNIKQYIDVDTFANIVNGITDACFVENHYHAENREIARRFVILKYMTDIEVDEAEIASIFAATQTGNWYGAIEHEVVKLPIWAEVEQAVDIQIASYPTAFDRLCDNISATINSNAEVNIAEIKEVLDKLSKVDKEEFVQAAVKKNTKKEK